MTKKKAVQPKGKEETVKEASSVSQDSKKIEKAKAAPSVKYKPLKITDMCDFMEENWKKGIFGGYTADSPACVECLEDFKESAEACIANTKAIQAKDSPEETKKPVKEKAVQVEIPGPLLITPENIVPAVVKKDPKAAITRSPLGSDITKGTGKIEVMLLSEVGASMKEMEACRGCVPNHLRALRERGATIEKKEVSGEVRYFARTK